VKRPELPQHQQVRGWAEPEWQPAPTRKPHRVRRFVVLGIVAVLVIVVGYVGVNYVQFLGGVSHIAALPSSSDLDGKEQNILLVGDDHRPANATAEQLAQLGTEQDGGGTNTDTMMILHIPASGDKISLISLPRDSWVAVPGYGMNKLNAAFSIGSADGKGDSGGASLLISTVSDLTGLTINHFVRVSLLGFYTIAQALGPIEVCLNNAVNDPYSTLNLPAGISTLNAQQALAFVRQRHGLPRGDLDREVRQQYFLSLEAHKIISAGTLLDPVKLHNVLGAISSSIQTDPNLDLISLAVRLHGVSKNNLTSATIPITGTPTIRVHGQGISIVQVDTAAMPAFIQTMTGKKAPKTAMDGVTAATPASVTVTVQNGRAVTGAAGAATSTLASAGFQTTAPSTVGATGLTTIEYPAGGEAGAKAVLAYVPGARTVQTAGIANVTLILGQDGLAVAAHPSSTGAGAPTNATSTPPSTTKAESYSATSCVN
jgi:LCP family protein required for cell wall assembly